MRDNCILTAESVTEGHPDKLCDTIADAVLDACQPGMPYPAECVDAKTRPCFIVAARDDGIVNVSSSLAFAQALEKAGVTFESHLYSCGQHGFSIGTPLITTGFITERVVHWVPDSIGWLGEIMGVFTNEGFTKPTLAPRMTTDDEEFLSVNCSLNHILRQPEPVQKIMAPLYDGVRAVAASMGSTFDRLCALMGAYTVKALLEAIRMPEETIEQIDAALKAIPNTL